MTTSTPAASTALSRRKAASFMGLRQSGSAMTSRSTPGCTLINPSRTCHGRREFWQPQTG